MVSFPFPKAFSRHLDTGTTNSFSLGQRQEGRRKSETQLLKVNFGNTKISWPLIPLTISWERCQTAGMATILPVLFTLTSLFMKKSQARKKGCVEKQFEENLFEGFPMTAPKLSQQMVNRTTD